MPKPIRNSRARGFSLLEVIMALAVVGVGLPAVCSVFYAATRQDSDIDSVMQAQYLANMLINEISRRRFQESSANPAGGPLSAEIDGYSRLLFVAISDYNIFQDTWGAQQPPRAEDGTPLTQFSNFSQNVTIYNVAPPGSGASARSFNSVSAGSTDFKMVNVTISWQGGHRSLNIAKVFALTP